MTLDFRLTFVCFVVCLALMCVRPAAFKSLHLIVWSASFGVVLVFVYDLLRLVRDRVHALPF
jgi:hypothetical protein